MMAQGGREFSLIEVRQCRKDMDKRWPHEPVVAVKGCYAFMTFQRGSVECGRCCDFDRLESAAAAMATSIGMGADVAKRKGKTVNLARVLLSVEVL